MNDAMVHRGPDDAGYFVDGAVGLAMRRLSIIDVAGGHQPIPNEDETAQIVFNGEIYNFHALHAELRDRGHRFRTRTDTEAILHAYEEWGDACVERLDGMFAFAIWDARRGANSERLFLARDRLGKKPIYWADVDGDFLFASAITPLLRDGRVSRELDPEALHHYLSLLYVPSPLGIFRAIRKLEPGHAMSVDRDGVRTWRWWSYQDYVGNTPAGPELEDELRKLLFAAVEKRLESEVPLGAFLSGGLDSSVVVAIMSRLMKQPVKTFSVGFEGPESHNELPMAKIVAEHCRTEHHEIVVKPDIVRLLPELVRYADEPFAISSAVPTYLMAKAARREITVVLTGDGGDEMFGGYEYYLYDRWARTYRRLPARADCAIARSIRFVPGRVDARVGRMRSRVERFVANARKPLGARRLGWMEGFDEPEKMALYSGDWPGRATGPTSDWLEAKVEARVRTFADEVQLNVLDVLVPLPDEMLTKVDRMTMAASLEARSPLLDWHLCETLARTSFADKIPGRRMSALKALLRKVAADLLPPAPRTRRKWGFIVPLGHWFRHGARAFLEETLSPENVRRHGVFRPEGVSDLVAAHLSGRINAPNRLYALLVFHVWADATLR